MLTLSMNGNVIPVPTDFSMQLTWKSPVCNFEKIPGSFGLGVSIPINEFTRRLFNFPERYAKSRVIGNLNFPGFEVRFGGVLLMAGSLTITNTTDTTYEASLVDQLGVLGDKENERDILEIVKFSEESTWELSTNYTPEEHSYCHFPIINNQFFKDKGLMISRTEQQPDVLRQGKMMDYTYDTELMSWLFEKTTKSVINKVIGGAVYAIQSNINVSNLDQLGNSYDTGLVTVVTPYLFLNGVIKEAIKDSDFHIVSNYMEQDEHLKNLCIYNNYDITKTSYEATGKILIYSLALGLIENAGEEMLKYQGITGKKLYRYMRQYDNKFTPKNHLPKMSVGELLMSTQNLWNVCFHFLPNKTINVFSREKLLADPATDINTYLAGKWKIGVQKCVALKFVRNHDKNDMIFAERWNDIADRRNNLKESVLDFPQLWAIENPVEGEIRLLASTGIFYEYKWITADKLNEQVMASDSLDMLGWAEFSIGLQNGWYEYGREQVEEIKTGWSTIYGNDQVNLAVQQGSMDTWKAKKQDFSPRLMFYNGSNSGGSTNSVISMEYEKKDIGILDVYWKQWNRFWANRLEVSGDFDLPVNALRHVIYNICKKYRTDDGEFLIDEMSCELFIDRIGVTQIKGFKV